MLSHGSAMDANGRSCDGDGNEVEENRMGVMVVLAVMAMVMAVCG